MPGLVGVEVRDITIFLLGGDRIGLSGVVVRLTGPEGGEIPCLGLSILLGPGAFSLGVCSAVLAGDLDLLGLGAGIGLLGGVMPWPAL